MDKRKRIIDNEKIFLKTSVALKISVTVRIKLFDLQPVHGQINTADTISLFKSQSTKLTINFKNDLYGI